MTRSPDPDAAPRYRPDALDRALLGQLRADGRASLAKLADVLGVARGTVQNRLDRLLATGTLLGFTARVRDDDDGTVRAVTMIAVSGRATQQVIRRLKSIAEVQALHTTNGHWDLVAEVPAASLGDFDRVLNEVRMIEGVANSETSLLLGTL